MLRSPVHTARIFPVAQRIQQLPHTISSFKNLPKAQQLPYIRHNTTRRFLSSPVKNEGHPVPPKKNSPSQSSQGPPPPQRQPRHQHHRPPPKVYSRQPNRQQPYGDPRQRPQQTNNPARIASMLDSNSGPPSRSFQRQGPRERFNPNAAMPGARTPNAPGNMGPGEQRQNLQPSWRANKESFSNRRTGGGATQVFNEFLRTVAKNTKSRNTPNPPAPRKPDGVDFIDSIRNKLDLPKTEGSSTGSPLSDRFKKVVPPTSRTGTAAQASEQSAEGADENAEKTTSPKSFLAEYIQGMKDRQKNNAAKSEPLLEKLPSYSGFSRYERQNLDNPTRRQAEVKKFEMKVFQETFREKTKQAGSSSKPKALVLPKIPVSITEAGDLMRVKTTLIRQTLRALGELPRSKNALSDREVMIEADVLELVAMELGIYFEAVEKKDTKSDKEILMRRRAAMNESESAYESFAPRPPVVCIMGHVDHGKTTLMDTLRRIARGKTKTKKPKRKKKKAKTAGDEEDGNDVAGTEAGGITQVISAFQVPLPGHEMGAVTFLDTPGHAAFKSMRQSGSDAADIIVLVVAADDGVSPQTIEIINFYKSIVKDSGGEGISLVVAMNKIDKPGINVEEARMRIENQLFEHNIFVEGMTGSSEGCVGAPAQIFPISALKGDGVDDLVEGLALQSEVMDLRADDSVNAEGYVMDARVQKGLGIVVDCVIRWGSIQKGDHVVSGVHSGKVRFLKNSEGETIKKGVPSQPIRLTGFDTVPNAGEPIICVSEEEFREQVKKRNAEFERLAMEEAGVTSTEDMELQSSGKVMMRKEWVDRLKEKHGMVEDEQKRNEQQIRIPILIRADADGSLSAIRESLVALGKESRHNVEVDPILTGVGPLLEAEIDIAEDSEAPIFCFNVQNSKDMSRRAEDQGVTLVVNDVIYRLIEQARIEFGKFLPMVREEKVHGRAEVGDVFDIGGISTRVAGLKVTDGTLYRDKTPHSKGRSTCFFRVLRSGEEVTDKDAKSTSLKHFKEDVTEIERGKECGLSLDSFNDYKVGDVIECYSFEMKHQELR